MDYIDKVYNYMKSVMEKNGLSKTVEEIAEELGILEEEVEEAAKKLKEAGKIMITDIPKKTAIEFKDEK
ncbi:MAG: hypothetical protein HFH41_06390 [Lachnospiraceae bacterium]|nr:hypothetical protein [Lachnospiraceae bacterium]